jgi:hypothetical protein
MLLVEWRHHLLGYWTGPSSPAMAVAVEQAVLKLAPLQRSGRCMYIANMLDGFNLPDAATRSAMIKVGPKLENKLHGFGLVIEGKGFRAAALRAFITGIAQLSGVRYPVPTFENIAAAEAWFAPRVQAAQDEWSAAELAIIDAELRARQRDRG